MGSILLMYRRINAFSSKEVCPYFCSFSLPVFKDFILLFVQTYFPMKFIEFTLRKIKISCNNVSTVTVSAVTFWLKTP